MMMVKSTSATKLQSSSSGSPDSASGSGGGAAAAAIAAAGGLSNYLHRRKSSNGSNHASKQVITRTLHFEPFVKVAALMSDPKKSDEVEAFLKGHDFDHLTLEDIDFFLPQIW
jgi:hypothetical protein